MSPGTDPIPASEKRVSLDAAVEPGAENASANAAPAAGLGAGPAAESAALAPSATPRSPWRDRAQAAKSRARFVGGRLLYWAPVWIALTLFAQFAFLGLRKAVSETRRLDAAEIALEARHERAETLSRALETELSARLDPVYRERQRRFHLAAPAQVPPATPGDASTSEPEAPDPSR